MVNYSFVPKSSIRGQKYYVKETLKEKAGISPILFPELYHTYSSSHFTKKEAFSSRNIYHA